MKTYAQNLTMLSAVIAFASCNSNKTEPHTEAEAQTETVTTDSVMQDTEKPAVETKTIEGVVKEMVSGKDGYTATIQANDNQVYRATISRANLNDPKQYRDFNDNEIVKLSGDFWKMENENQITVREIK